MDSPCLFPSGLGLCGIVGHCKHGLILLAFEKTVSRIVSAPSSTRSLVHDSTRPLVVSLGGALVSPDNQELYIVLTTPLRDVQKEVTPTKSRGSRMVALYCTVLGVEPRLLADNSPSPGSGTDIVGSE